ncbi:hypothetical protein N9C34_04155 [Candidatus Marinimicrobia bacterium]|nr:hypothetical protein [Candidatus Neomarinimicrobiota bacterium]
MKKLDQYRERIFSASITEIVLLMLFMILAVATLYKADRDKYKSAIEEVFDTEIVSYIDSLSIDSIKTSQTLQDLKNKMTSLDSDSLLQEISELQEFKDKNRGPDVCGLQNDRSERLINQLDNESIILFNIEFSKYNNKYRLYFYPSNEHVNNVKLNIVTPNISKRRFDFEYNKNGKINFNELRNFLEPIKNSRRINQNDSRCNTKEYKNKGLCLECVYQVSIIDKNVSASDLKQVYKVLEGYFYVRKD